MFRPCRTVLAAIWVFCLGFSMIGCRPDDENASIDLPSTPVLSVQSSWAVITSSHLRLRELPSLSARPLTTLWRGNVLEVVSKQNRKESVDGLSDFWYQISYDGLGGWVFGGYLELFDSAERARDAARALDQ